MKKLVLETTAPFQGLPELVAYDEGLFEKEGLAVEWADREKGVEKKVEVNVTVEKGCVIVTVTDDGVGVPPAPTRRGRGLENLAARARHLGGTFEIGAGAVRGTVAVWSVPAGGS